ncbi:intermembrane transport protein PqiB [Paludibacterium purpuratum]|uniref:Paraquat-inducible protein B n=1 Tax=Paludibacterium purpuratum TaxID=1144873 RepID=A0A4V3DV93_9NEIS|nr:MlaD family protein [Paludibacterium purpuratum]TDR79899.1 paraquat-inducible protein B [Paludibacterium purpuratum]
MTEPDPSSHDTLPAAKVLPQRRLNPSLVWLVPLLTALIGGWLVVTTVLSRGPTITIAFSSGQGLEAGKTRIKYKDVDIGEVTAVTLSPDRRHILVRARLVRDAIPYLVADSRFWVVRPRISGGTVSGLDTLLSGSYIAMDVGRASQTSDTFTALDEAPIVSGDRPGRQFTLLAEDLGSLEVGSPVLYRRVPVGQVVGYRLSADGQSVAVAVFVNQPYDRYVTATSRFWHASGIDVSVDAAGVKLATQSLVAVALGGVAFDTPDSDEHQPEASPEQNFVLARDHDQAMRRVETDVKRMQVRFADSVRGLAIGAPVDFRGIVIGEVSGITLDPATVIGHPQMRVSLQIYPGRLVAAVGGRSTAIRLSDEQVARAVAKGLRAQLRTSSLLTGQLYVALDYFPAAAPAALGRAGSVTVLPSVPGDMGELQQSLTRIAHSIDRMQLDVLSADARRTLGTLNTTLSHADGLMGDVRSQDLPQLLSTLQSLQQTLDSARQSLRPDAPLQQDLRDAAREVTSAAQSVRNLSDTLQRHPEALIRGKPGDAP